MNNTLKRKDDIIDEIFQIILKESNYKYCNVTELENFVEKNNINLNDLNDENFDIIIEVINRFYEFQFKDDYYCVKVVKFILQHCHYPTLNYMVEYKNQSDIINVPLFNAITRRKFKVAKLLINHGADINYKVYGMNLFKFLIHYQLGLGITSYHYTISKDIIKFVLNNGFHRSNFNTETVQYFIFYNLTHFLEIIFKHYSHNLSIILSFLFLYKNKKVISNKDIGNLVNELKLKIKEDDLYQFIINYKSYENYDISEALDLIYKNDWCSHEDKRNKIKKYELIDIALKQNDEKFLKTILNDKVFDINQKNVEDILYQTIQYDCKENIYNTLIDFLTKNYFDFKSIDYEKVLLTASKKENKDIMKFLYNLFFIVHILYRKKYIKISNLETFDKPFQLLILNIAIKLNNLMLVRCILKNEKLKLFININDKDRNGEYPIFVAYSSAKYYADKTPESSIQILQYLLGIPNINIYIKIKKSLIRLALYERQYKILKCLLKRPLPVNQDDLNVDADPLIRAICKNDLKSVQALLKNHDDELNKFSNSIQILSQDERESLIIKRKSDFMGYSCNTDGFNAFILAYLLDRKDIFNFLINDNIIFSKDENNYFFFDYVILKEDVSMIRELIRMDICSFFDKKKVNPLNICVKIENKELFSLLLKCKNIDMEMINESNETILLSIINSHFMVEDKIELIKKLLNKGYDINYIPECYDTNEEEYTINNAIKKGEPRLIKFLLENDVCASSTYDRYAKSSLDLAIKVASVPIVDLLLRYNSYNSEIITEKFDYYLGSAILSKADISKVREIVKIMINHGGNVDVTTVSHIIYLDPDISVFELVINELNKKNLRGDGMDREIELTFIEIFLDRIIVEMDNNCYSNGMNYIKCIFKNLIHHEENYGKCYEYLEKVDTANKIELLRWLIENRLDFFTLDVISVIIREGHLTIIKDLIDHNVDLNRQDTNGYTPVYLAYLFKEERILNYLIKRYGVKIYSLNRQHEDFIACLHRKRCFQALEFYFDSDRTNKRHKIK